MYYLCCSVTKLGQGSVRDSDGPREPRRPISFPLFIYHHHRRFISSSLSLSLSSSPARQRGRERPAATAAFAFSLLRDFLLFRRAGGVTGRLPRLSSGRVPFVYLPSSLSLSASFCRVRAAPKALTMTTHRAGKELAGRKLLFRSELWALASLCMELWPSLLRTASPKFILKGTAA